MIQPMKRFCRLTRNSAIVTDERGLSTVEYVIILVLIAAAAVGTWTTFGATITTKISDSNATIGSVTIPATPTQ